MYTHCNIGWSDTLELLIIETIQTRGSVISLVDERPTDRPEPSVTTWYELGWRRVRRTQFFDREYVDVTDWKAILDKTAKVVCIESNPDLYRWGVFDPNLEVSCGQCLECSDYSPEIFARTVHDANLVRAAEIAEGDFNHCPCCDNPSDGMFARLEAELRTQLRKQDSELGHLARLLWDEEAEGEED